MTAIVQLSYNQPSKLISGVCAMATCAFKGCRKSARSAGFCNGHYRQHREGETLRPLQLQFHGLSEKERLLKRMVKVGDCWNWTGSRNRRQWHGQWRNRDGEIELVHRAAWRLFVGPIPKGMFVLHRCDNPVCLNLKHLFIGDQRMNLMDMWAKRRANPKQSLGEAHGMAKLTTEAVRMIRSSNATPEELATRFGVSKTTIYDVVTRKTWKHI